MKCKACDAMLSEKALARKGADGEPMDLCDYCHAAVMEEVYRMEYERMELEPIPELTRAEEDRIFSYTVARHGMLEKWRDRLHGDSIRAAMNMEEEAYRRFRDFLANGEKAQLAAEKACGIITPLRERGIITIEVW